jgi:hypothetical protein
MDATVFTLPVMPRKQLPESEKRVGVAARIYPSLIEALQELGREDDRTFSYMVERAIREYVERHGKRRPKPRE